MDKEKEKEKLIINPNATWTDVKKNRQPLKYLPNGDLDLDSDFYEVFDEAFDDMFDAKNRQSLPDYRHADKNDSATYDKVIRKYIYFMREVKEKTNVLLKPKRMKILTFDVHLDFKVDATVTDDYGRKWIVNLSVDEPLEYFRDAGKNVFDNLVEVFYLSIIKGREQFDKESKQFEDKINKFLKNEL